MGKFKKLYETTMKENYSFLTAISRNRLSAPLFYLISHTCLHGRILDYGCGKGGDADRLRQLGFDVTQYDPYYFPLCPDGFFDIVLCIYVLNVIDVDEQQRVISIVLQYLAPGSVAYFVVRRDIPRVGYRVEKKDYFTMQRYVELDMEIIHENKNYCIYCYRHKV